MKALKLTFKIPIFILAFLCTINLNAQEYAERMLYRETYSSQNVKNFKIINKHGSIHLKNWDKDSIEISTDLYISASSLKKLEKLKNGIKVKYNKHHSDITAQTIFGDNKVSFLSDLQGLGNSLTPVVEKHIEINYTVYIPKDINIEIQNQFGDVSLGEINNTLQIDLLNGSFKAHDLTQKATLNFSFVNAMLNNSKDLKLDLKYSTINLTKSVNIDFQSRSSELFIDEIGVLKIKSYRDKLNIGELDYMFGTANYTNVRVDKLLREIDGYFTYGKITVDKIHKEASLIDIDSERTDIKLYVSKAHGYNYDILFHRDANLLLSEKDYKPANDLEAEDIKAIKGKFGSNPKLDIRIRALKRCVIQILNITE